MSYAAVYEGWKANPEAFWLEAARSIDWDRFPSKALNDSNAPFYTWFDDG
ncbi:MAG: hypothetical protein KUG70_00645, partial [Rhodobacteraceae bacterium]|nr:hypothetical protein [Paracoccaceae bacterium]